MAGTAFTVARHPRLVAHAGGEVADKQAHGEHHAEGEQILDIRHRQRPARGDKKRSKLMTLITVASTDGQRP